MRRLKGKQLLTEMCMGCEDDLRGGHLRDGVLGWALGKASCRKGCHSCVSKAAGRSMSRQA